jgi:hypothetical protein
MAGPNNKRILHPAPRKRFAKMILAGKTDAEIKLELGRPDLDMKWFRDWLTPSVIKFYEFDK